MTTPDPAPIDEEQQRAEARGLALFIGLVSLSFFLLVGLAMGWRVYSMHARKTMLHEQELEERARAQKADRAAWKAAKAAEAAKAAKAAQVNSQTR